MLKDMRLRLQVIMHTLRVKGLLHLLKVVMLRVIKPKQLTDMLMLRVMKHMLQVKYHMLKVKEPQRLVIILMLKV